MASSSAVRPAVINLSLRSASTTFANVLLAQAWRATFCTTAARCKRKTKDNNKKRGVSSLYRSGPKEHLSMSDVKLPKPLMIKPNLGVDKNHGLWGFFPAPGKILWTPEEYEQHGRAWSVEELRKKSWEDLHSLWWVCCRERNMLATSLHVLEKHKVGFGDWEITERDDEIKKTMKAIKYTLTERLYTWQDARDVAQTDPEINLQGTEGEIYTPSAYEDEMEGDESWREESEKLGSSESSESSNSAKSVADSLLNTPGRENVRSKQEAPQL